MKVPVLLRVSSTFSVVFSFVGSMADDITNLWSNLSLIDKEKVGVESGDSKVAPTLSKGQFCLIVKIITERSFNREAFKLTMSKVGVLALILFSMKWGFALPNLILKMLFVVSQSWSFGK